MNSIFAKIGAKPDVRKMVEEVQGGVVVCAPRQDFAAFIKREYGPLDAGDPRGWHPYRVAPSGWKGPLLRGRPFSFAISRRRGV